MAWSILKFSGEEIIELATDIEKAGKAFYDKAAREVSDPELSALPGEGPHTDAGPS
ncbi:MAG: hypothetical protein ACYC4H_03255 [Desulfocucumaceae bacterium]